MLLLIFVFALCLSCCGCILLSTRNTNDVNRENLGVVLCIVGTILIAVTYAVSFSRSVI